MLKKADFVKAMVLAVLAVSMTACAKKGTIKDVPPGVVVRTETVEVIKKEYVPIHADLSKRCAWTKGVKPSKALTELVIRKGCLEQYERQFDAIEKIQGKPTK